MRLSSLWFGLVFSLSGAVAIADVPADPAKVQALKVGDAAPAFSGLSVDGVERTFPAGAYAKPTVVIFYRGGWCPYCNLQLADLRLVEPRLRASGFEVVFLSTDRPELLYSSLKEKDIHYTLLSDHHSAAAEAFRVAYRLDDATLAELREYGIDVEATTGTKRHELPVPSVFVIDKAGVIRFVYSNPDYTVRLGADALWSAASGLAAR